MSLGELDEMVSEKPQRLFKTRYLIEHAKAGEQWAARYLYWKISQSMMSGNATQEEMDFVSDVFLGIHRAKTQSDILRALHLLQGHRGPTPEIIERAIALAVFAALSQVAASGRRPSNVAAYKVAKAELERQGYGAVIKLSADNLRKIWERWRKLDRARKVIGVRTRARK
jgi:hypothetical protein